MFDNLPFHTHDIPTIKKIIQSDHVTFIGDSFSYNRLTGEEKSRTCYYKFYNISMYVKYYGQKPVVLEAKGSFHYLMNEGIHNADNLTFEQMLDCLLNFGGMFGIDLKKLKLRPPEFAQMIVIPFDIEQVVENVFYEQRKKFIDNAPGEPSRISGKVSNDYRLKIYSKYHEHSKYCEPNTLRLEYQAKKMRALHNLGIETLNDLTERRNWVKIMELHNRYFKHVVLYDHTIKLPPRSTYRKKVADYSNQNWWQNLIRDTKRGKKYSTRYNDEVSMLNRLSKRYGSDMLSEILNLSEKQWIKSLGICLNTSKYLIKKPKEAPLQIQKQAPFIGCLTCYLPGSILMVTR